MDTNQLTRAQDIQIYDCENNITDIYCGKFTETEWKPMSGGFAGLTFKFTCNSAYGKKKFSQTYSINGSKINITINNLTDELEEYVYPVLDIYQTSTTNANITIKNKTDNNNSMSFLTRRNNHMIIDCKNCIPSVDVGIGIGVQSPRYDACYYFSAKSYLKFPNPIYAKKTIWGLTINMWVRLDSGCGEYATILSGLNNPTSNFPWLAVNTESSGLWSYIWSNAPQYGRGIQRND